MSPIAVPNDDSVADVVWGTHPDTGHFASFMATALWHARFDGERWSAPEKIAEADAIWWDASSVAVVNVADVLHVVARAYDNVHSAQPWSGAIYARWRDHHWSVTPLHPPHFVPRYLAVFGTGDELQLLYTGTVREGSSLEFNALARMRSSDNGLTWSDPKLIRRLTGRNGYWLRADSLPPNGLQLSWVALPDTTSDVSRVEQLVSTDGEVWRDAIALEVPGRVSAYASVDSRSGLHLVLQSMENAAYTVNWRLEGWSSLTAIPADGPVSTPTFLRIAGDRTLLAWNTLFQAAVPNNSSLAPHLVTSQLTETCRER